MALPRRFFTVSESSTVALAVLVTSASLVPAGLDITGFPPPDITGFPENGGPWLAGAMGRE